MRPFKYRLTHLIKHWAVPCVVWHLFHSPNGHRSCGPNTTSLCFCRKKPDSHKVEAISSLAEPRYPGQSVYCCRLQTAGLKAHTLTDSMHQQQKETCLRYIYIRMWWCWWECTEHVPCSASVPHCRMKIIHTVFMCVRNEVHPLLFFY